jgi:hypothetical protein
MDARCGDDLVSGLQSVGGARLLPSKKTILEKKPAHPSMGERINRRGIPITSVKGNPITPGHEHGLSDNDDNGPEIRDDIPARLHPSGRVRFVKPDPVIRRPIIINLPHA